MLDSGQYASRASLARDLSVSRVRVTQVLRLLRLAPEVLGKIAGLEDPLTSPIVTERKLRPLVNLSVTKQKRTLENFKPPL